jgi:hypothetical protein
MVVADVRQGHENPIAPGGNLDKVTKILLKHSEWIAGYEAPSRHEEKTAVHDREGVVLAFADGYSSALAERTPKVNVGIRQAHSSVVQQNA